MKTINADMLINEINRVLPDWSEEKEIVLDTITNMPCLSDATEDTNTLHRKMAELEAHCDCLVKHKEDARRYFNAEIEKRDAVINALKFAVRCNGISGAEVVDDMGDCE